MQNNDHGESPRTDARRIDARRIDARPMDAHEFARNICRVLSKVPVRPGTWSHGLIIDPFSCPSRISFRSNYQSSELYYIEKIDLEKVIEELFK